MTSRNARILVISAFLLGAVFGASGVIAIRSGMTGVAHAQAVPTGGGCNNGSLYGAYGLKVQGYALAAPDGTPLASPAPLDVIGAVTADGSGGTSGVSTVDVAGVVQQGSSTGTYSVNANCTVTMTVSTKSGLTLHLAGVLVDNNNKGYFMDADPGRSNAQATLEKQ